MLVSSGRLLGVCGKCLSSIAFGGPSGVTTRHQVKRLVVIGTYNIQHIKVL